MRGVRFALFAMLAVGCAAPSGEVPSEQLEETDVEDVATAEQAAESSSAGLAAWAIPLGHMQTARVASDTAGNALFFGHLYDDGTWVNPRQFFIKLDPYGKELFRREYPRGVMHAGFGRDGSLALVGPEDGTSRDFGCGPRDGAFVVKLAPDGKCVFHATVTATQWVPNDVRLASNGDVLVAGDGSGTVAFDAQNSHAVDYQLLVARYGATGTVRWSKKFGEALAGRRRPMQYIHDLELDASGKVYLAGYHYGTIDFGGGPMKSPMNGAPPGSAFFATLDADGNFIRARSFGAGAQATALDVMADGRAAIAGTFTGTIDLGGKTLTNTSSSYDTFVAVYEPSGAVRWVKKFWGNAGAEVKNVAFDSNGYLVVGGNVDAPYNASSASWHIGAFDFTVRPFSSFVARFTPGTGATKWANVYNTNFPDDGYTPLTQIADLAVAPNNGRVLVIGETTGSLDLGRGKTVPRGKFITRLYP